MAEPTEPVMTFDEFKSFPPLLRAQIYQGLAIGAGLFVEQMTDEQLQLLGHGFFRDSEAAKAAEGTPYEYRNMYQSLEQELVVQGNRAAANVIGDADLIENEPLFDLGLQMAASMGVSAVYRGAFQAGGTIFSAGARMTPRMLRNARFGSLAAARYAAATTLDDAAVKLATGAPMSMLQTLSATLQASPSATQHALRIVMQRGGRGANWLRNLPWQARVAYPAYAGTMSLASLIDQVVNVEANEVARMDAAYERDLIELGAMGAEIEGLQSIGVDTTELGERMAMPASMRRGQLGPTPADAVTRRTAERYRNPNIGNRRSRAATYPRPTGGTPTEPPTPPATGTTARQGQTPSAEAPGIGDSGIDLSQYTNVDEFDMAVASGELDLPLPQLMMLRRQFETRSKDPFIRIPDGWVTPASGPHNVRTGFWQPEDEKVEWYRESDVQRMLAQLDPGEIAALQLRLADAGFFDKNSVVLGTADLQVEDAFSKVLGQANFDGIPWEVTLDNMVKGYQEALRQQTKPKRTLFRSRLVPDYAMLSQTAKDAVTSKLGRKPNDWEVELLADELRAGYRAKADEEYRYQYAQWEAQGRAEEYGDDEVVDLGTFTEVDPMARMQEKFDEQFAPEMEAIDRWNQVQGSMGNLMGGLNRISNLMG